MKLAECTNDELMTSHMGEMERVNNSNKPEGSMNIDTNFKFSDPLIPLL